MQAFRWTILYAALGLVDTTPLQHHPADSKCPANTGVEPLGRLPREEAPNLIGLEREATKEDTYGKEASSKRSMSTLTGAVFETQEMAEQLQRPKRRTVHNELGQSRRGQIANRSPSNEREEKQRKQSPGTSGTSIDGSTGYQQYAAAVDAADGARDELSSTAQERGAASSISETLVESRISSGAGLPLTLNLCTRHPMSILLPCKPRSMIGLARSRPDHAE